MGILIRLITWHCRNAFGKRSGALQRRWSSDHPIAIAVSTPDSAMAQNAFSLPAVTGGTPRGASISALLFTSGGIAGDINS
jgi:hypothetical protein